MRVLFLGGTSYLGLEIIKMMVHFPLCEISVLVRTEASSQKLSGLPVKIIGLGEIFESAPFDIVYNLIVDYGKDLKSFEDLYKVNVEFPLNQLRKIKFNTVINFSTSLPEEVSSYARTKKNLEIELASLGIKERFQVLNLQLQHFYGPGTPDHNFVTFLFKKMLLNEDIPLTICDQNRDFIFIDDLLEAIALITEKKNDLSNIETIEIGSGEPVILKKFIEKVHILTKSKSKLLFGRIPKRLHEPEELKANLKVLKGLEWKPKTSLNDGLEKTLRYFQGR
jgi:CDP-paratose synthetase